MSLPYMYASEILNESAELVSQLAVNKIERAATVGVVGVVPSRQDGFDLDLVVAKGFGSRYNSIDTYAHEAGLKVLDIAHLDEQEHPLELLEVNSFGYQTRYMARVPLRLREISWIADALNSMNLGEELRAAEKKLEAARANTKIVDELFAPFISTGYSEHHIGDVMETTDGYDLVLSPPKRVYNSRFHDHERKQQSVISVTAVEAKVRKRFGFVQVGDGLIVYDPEKERIERDFVGFSNYVQAVVCPMEKSWDCIGIIAIRGKANKERFEKVFLEASTQYDAKLEQAGAPFKQGMGKDMYGSEISTGVEPSRSEFRGRRHPRGKGLGCGDA